MDLETSIRVLCLCEPSVLKGLQWAVEKAELGSTRIHLFPATLNQLQTINFSDVDLVFLSLDLGQPVPLEHLKKINKRRAGLCAIQHPTPQQLLDLGSLHCWKPIQWDGVAFDRLVAELEKISRDYFIQLNKEKFIESCEIWVDQKKRLPARVEIISAPQNWPGIRETSLTSSNQKHLRVGALESGADFCLPSSGKDILGEFRLVDGVWIFKGLAPGVSDFPNGLIPGDQISILEHRLLIKADESVQDLVQIADSFDAFTHSESEDMNNTLEVASFENQIRILLGSGVVGELQVQAEMRTGTIYFSHGYIIHAVTGSVIGMKAVQRMLSWNSTRSRFIKDHRPSKNLSNLYVNLLDFDRMFHLWRKEWLRLSSLAPSLSIKLKVNPMKYSDVSGWNYRDYSVVASIAEFRLVRDILNYCSLTDVEILDSLVSLRKRGLIEIDR